MQNDVFERCRTVLDELEAGPEREAEEAGEAGYREVEKVESKAPMPSPCVDAYNTTVEALVEYERALVGFEPGRFHNLRASLEARRA